MSLTKAVALATELETRLATFEALYGEKWPAEVDRLEPLVRQHMADMKTDNPIKVGIRFGKEMAADGKDPNYLLAICSALALRDHAKPAPANPP